MLPYITFCAPTPYISILLRTRNTLSLCMTFRLVVWIGCEVCEEPPLWNVRINDFPGSETLCLEQRYLSSTLKIAVQSSLIRQKSSRCLSINDQTISHQCGAADARLPKPICGLSVLKHPNTLSCNIQISIYVI